MMDNKIIDYYTVYVRHKSFLCFVEFFNAIFSAALSPKAIFNERKYDTPVVFQWNRSKKTKRAVRTHRKRVFHLLLQFLTCLSSNPKKFIKRKLHNIRTKTNRFGYLCFVFILRNKPLSATESAPVTPLKQKVSIPTSS